MTAKTSASRRHFLGASAAVAALPIVVPKYALGAAPSDKIVMGAIGMGGRGRSVLGSFLRFPQVQVVAVCDVVGRHAQLAKQQVDQHHGNNDCKSYGDYRDVIARDDIDAVLIATPDHWHAIISIEAMVNGMDVFCEKPESLTIAEGRRMVEIARRYGRVFSGGSQRVWGDYNWFHRMVRGGAIGDVQECWVNVGEPSGPCYLAPEDTPDDVDWDMWLGPAPARPFHSSLIQGGFRPYRDYSGGGTTDWGCHGFGGAMFCLDLHESGPVEIEHPGKDDPQTATVVWPNGVRMHHGGGTGGLLSFSGTDGYINEESRKAKTHQVPDIYIPNYKGKGGIFGDFLHCVKTRERPFRDIERAHRTATVCHLLNISYWLDRPLKWDAEREEIIDDPEANRWLDRPQREPWSIA